MSDQVEQEKRESFLLIFYLLAVCAVFFVLLLAITVPFILGMVVVTGGIVGFATLHWMLWGHLLTRAATAEPEAKQEEMPVSTVQTEDDPYRGRY